MADQNKNQNDPCGDGRPPLTMFAIPLQLTKKPEQEQQRRRNPRVSRASKSSTNQDTGIKVDKRGRNVGYADTSDSKHQKRVEMFRNLSLFSMFEEGASNFPDCWGKELCREARLLLEKMDFRPYLDRHAGLVLHWRRNSKSRPEVVNRNQLSFQTRLSLDAEPVHVEHGHAVTATAPHRLDEPTLDLGAIQVIQIEEETPGLLELQMAELPDYCKDFPDFLGWHPLPANGEEIAAENLPHQPDGCTLQLDEVYN